MNSKTKALAIAGAASDKKAFDIITIDMRKMSNVCSYFVIASGASTTQVRAIADHIREGLDKREERVRHVEGEREASWLLMDCGDVAVHIFLEPTRRFYDLERLWQDAPQCRFEDAGVRKRSVKKKKRPAVRKKRRGLKSKSR